MYLEVIEARVNPGKMADFEERIAQTMAFLAGRPGFGSGILQKSLGRPNLYRVTFRWEDEDSAWVFRLSQDWRGYQTDSPQPVFAATPDGMEAYELAHVVGDAPGEWTAVSKWTIDPGRAAEFETDRRELANVALATAPGHARTLLFRYVGNGSRYNEVRWATSRESLRAHQAVPAIRAFFDQHPWTDYAATAPTEEWFRVVRHY